MNNSLVGVYDGSLSTAAIADMARKQLLDPSQTAQLYALKKEIIRQGGEVKSNTPTLVGIISALHDRTLTQDDLNKDVSKGLLSQSDYKLYSAAINEKDTALKQVRTTLSKSVYKDVFGDLGMGTLFQTQEMMTAKAKFDAQARSREQQYIKEGKDPMDYWTSDEYRKDAMALAPTKGLLGGADDIRSQIQTDLQAGKPIQLPSGGWVKWDGKGNILNPASLVPTEAPAEALPSGFVDRASQRIDEAIQKSGIKTPPPAPNSGTIQR